MGPSGIHPRVLKERADIIPRALNYFSMVLRIWRKWTLANIVPIFKKGKKDNPGNYRPVSLTSVPGKIMEKIMVRVHEKHLKDNAVIGHSLRRFMRGRSCLTNLIFFYDQGDKEKPVGVIFFRFQ